MNDEKDNSTVYAIAAAAVTLVVVLAIGAADDNTGVRRMHWLAGLFYSLGGPTAVAIAAAIAAGGLTWVFTKK